MLQENDPESKRRKTNPEEQEVFTVTGTWKKLNDFIRKKVEVNNESVGRSPWRFLKKKMQTAKKKRNHLFFIDIGILRFSLLHHILSFLRVDFCICVQIEYQCVFFVRKNICFSGCIQDTEYESSSLHYCLDFDLIRYEICCKTNCRKHPAANFARNRFSGVIDPRDRKSYLWQAVNFRRSRKKQNAGWWQRLFPGSHAPTEGSSLPLFLTAITPGGNLRHPPCVCGNQPVHNRRSDMLE